MHTTHFDSPVARITELAAADRFSGVICIQQGGVTLVKRAFGLGSRRWNTPVVPEMRFDTASITKLFTAVSVLQQIDRGRLSLDTRIHDCVDLTGTAIPTSVTIGQLLCHTSGIADDADEEAGESYEQLWRDRPNYSVTETRDFLPQFIHKEPVFAPGEGCRYNNVGYVLLGLAVEEATGRRFREHIQHSVFDPAGMAASGFYDMRAAEDNVAEGWDPKENDDGEIIGWVQNIYSYPPIGSPDGGAHSTAEDLLRFIRAVRDGVLLSPESTQAFFTPQVLHHRLPESAPTSVRELHYGFGVEFELNAAGGIRSLYKDGVNAGSSGVLRHFPSMDLDYVVLSNSEDGAWPVIDLLEETISPHLRPATEPEA